MANTHSLDLESGSTQYAGISDASQTNLDFTSGAFSIEAYLYLESIASEFHIVSKWQTSPSNRQYRFMIDNSGARFRLDTSSAGTGETQTLANIGFTLSTSTWYHVAVTKTGTTAKFYLDASEKTVTSGAPDSTLYNSGAPVRVGANGNSTPGGLYDGLIDEVRIWSDVRTGAEISANKDKELDGTEANLEAYWKFNNDYTDETSNGNDLTASGSPVFSTTVPFVGGAFTPQIIMS